MDQSLGKKATWSLSPPVYYLSSIHAYGPSFGKESSMQPFTSCVIPVIKPCLWIILLERKQHAAFHLLCMTVIKSMLMDHPLGKKATCSLSPPVQYLSSIHAYGSIFEERKQNGAFPLLCNTCHQSMLMDHPLGKKATWSLSPPV
jgi:hypothetical protein